MARSHSTATTSESSTNVATRKRARRAKGDVAKTSAPAKPIVDLTHPNASAILAATFSSPVERVVVATEVEEAAALAYIEAREAESRAKGVKEGSGNVLRYAIGNATEIHGRGWKATWKPQKSQIDWGALVKDLGIESEVIERYRRAPSRVLLVHETAEE